MKFNPTLSVLLAGSVLLLNSCRSYEAVSPATVFDSTNVVAIQTRDKVERVNLSPIQAAISNSTWHSGSFLDKGSYRLEIKDAPDVFVSIYGAVFWIEGQRGYYEVRESERDEFVKFFRMLKERKGARWRPNHG